MNKADYIFHRDRKKQITTISKQSINHNDLWLFGTYPANSPIFIPRKKKKK